MNVSIHYLHFCNVISHGPATDCVDTIAMVMKLSGGTTDPNQIAVWWNQWQALKQAMKDNHPMVKLAAALCPADPAPVPVPVPSTPQHPKEFKHGGTRMVKVPVRIHWSIGNTGGVADYEAIASLDDKAAGFRISEFNWTEGNFGCDCNRALAIGLTKESHPFLFGDEGDYKCGHRITLARVESLDPLIPSLELDEIDDDAEPAPATSFPPEPPLGSPLIDRDPSAN